MEKLFHSNSPEMSRSDWKIESWCHWAPCYLLSVQGSSSTRTDVYIPGSPGGRRQFLRRFTLLTSGTGSKAGQFSSNDKIMSEKYETAFWSFLVWPHRLTLKQYQFNKSDNKVKVLLVHVIFFVFSQGNCLAAGVESSFVSNLFFQ